MIIKRELQRKPLVCKDFKVPSFIFALFSLLSNTQFIRKKKGLKIAKKILNEVIFW